MLFGSFTGSARSQQPDAAAPLAPDADDEALQGLLEQLHTRLHLPYKAAEHRLRAQGGFEVGHFEGDSSGDDGGDDDDDDDDDVDGDDDGSGDGAGDVADDGDDGRSGEGSGSNRHTPRGPAGGEVASARPGSEADGSPQAPAASGHSSHPAGPAADARFRASVLVASPCVVRRPDPDEPYYALDKVRGSTERAVVTEQLRRGTVDVRVEFSYLTKQVLQSELSRPANVLHIGAHASDTQLVLESNRGGSAVINHSGLEELLLNAQDHWAQVSKDDQQPGGRALLEDRIALPIHVAVVAACHSAWIGRLLVRAGVRHVVCIDDDVDIQSKATLQFVETLYRHLAAGAPFSVAFQASKNSVSAASLRGARGQATRFILLPEVVPHSAAGGGASDGLPEPVQRAASDGAPFEEHDWRRSCTCDASHHTDRVFPPPPPQQFLPRQQVVALWEAVKQDVHQGITSSEITDMAVLQWAVLAGTLGSRDPSLRSELAEPRTAGRTIVRGFGVGHHVAPAEQPAVPMERSLGESCGDAFVYAESAGPFELARLLLDDVHQRTWRPPSLEQMAAHEHKYRVQLRKKSGMPELRLQRSTGDSQSVEDEPGAPLASSLGSLESANLAGLFPAGVVDDGGPRNESLVSGLPAEVSPLIGRMVHLHHLLFEVYSERTRLLTIHGEKGLGKSSLLIECLRYLAFRRVDRFRHGIVYVDLASNTVGAERGGSDMAAFLQAAAKRNAELADQHFALVREAATAATTPTSSPADSVHLSRATAAAAGAGHGLLGAGVEPDKYGAASPSAPPDAPEVDVATWRTDGGHHHHHHSVSTDAPDLALAATLRPSGLAPQRPALAATAVGSLQSPLTPAKVVAGDPTTTCLQQPASLPLLRLALAVLGQYAVQRLLAPFGLAPGSEPPPSVAAAQQSAGPQGTPSAALGSPQLMPRSHSIGTPFSAPVPFLTAGAVVSALKKALAQTRGLLALDHTEQLDASLCVRLLHEILRHSRYMCVIQTSLHPLFAQEGDGGVSVEAQVGKQAEGGSPPSTFGALNRALGTPSDWPCPRLSDDDSVALLCWHLGTLPGRPAADEASDEYRTDVQPCGGNPELIRKKAEDFRRSALQIGWPLTRQRGRARQAAGGTAEPQAGAAGQPHPADDSRSDSDSEEGDEEGQEPSLLVPASPLEQVHLGRIAATYGTTPSTQSSPHHGGDMYGLPTLSGGGRDRSRRSRRRHQQGPASSQRRHQLRRNR